MTDKLRDFQKNLPMALLRARETIMSQFRPIMREHDITEQQWRVIRALHGLDGLEPTALAQKTMLLMPSLTRILKTLEEQKLVKRFAVEGDNRRIRAFRRLGSLKIHYPRDTHCRENRDWLSKSDSSCRALA